MKKLTIIIFIFISFRISAQLPSFPDDSPDQVFMQMENYINISLNGVDPELVDFKVSGEHRSTKLNDSLYSVYLVSQPEELSLKLYYKNIIIQQKKVKVRPSLQLQIELMHEKSGKISKKDLVITDGFLITGGDSKIPSQFSFRLFSGTLTIFGLNGQILFSNNIRDRLWPDQVKSLLKDLPGGTRIALANPRVINQNNQSIPCDHYKEWILID